MQGGLDENLNRLVLSLAKIVAFTKENNLINDSNSKKFKTIEENYFALTRGGIDVLKYNFRPLKRDLNALIHPDLAQENMKEKVGALAAEFNGIIDDIQKSQKTLGNSYYWTYKPKSNENTNTKTETKPQQENSTEPYDPLFDTIKDLWNLLLHKVPRDSNDYFKLKTNYENLISKLNEKITNKNEMLATLRKNLTTLEQNWRKHTSPQEIEKIYRDKLNKLTKEYETLRNGRSNTLNSIDKTKKRIIDTSRDEIDERIQRMNHEMIRMDKAYRELSRLDPSYDKLYYKKTKYTCAEIRKQMEEKFKQFPNIDAIRKYVIDDFISDDERYQTEVSRLEKIERELSSLTKELNYYHNRSDDVRKNIVSEIDSDYKRRHDSLSRKKRLITSKNEKLKNKVETAKNKYAVFLEKYQSLYERSNEKGKSK